MDLLKKGFHLPDKIRFDEETLSNTYGKMIAEPLERGFGTTMGNALRRVLLSSIEGASATGVRIRGAVHEFDLLEGVKEDVVDIILNIKALNFSMESNTTKTAIVKVTGPKVVTGADLQVDSSVTVLNPEQVIATVDKDVEFEAEIYVEKGKGYVVAEEEPDDEQSVDVIAIDALFSPIIKVNFIVEKARVGRSTDYDRLVLEIWTDGGISPAKAVSQAASILIEHFSLVVFERDADDEIPARMVESGSEETVFNENLLKSVDELELSVRAHNCLKNAEIDTIADLVQRTEYDMLRTKNFGRKSLNEIKEILHTMGLHFGMRVDKAALKSARGESNET